LYSTGYLKNSIFEELSCCKKISANINLKSDQQDESNRDTAVFPEGISLPKLLPSKQEGESDPQQVDLGPEEVEVRVGTPGLGRGGQAGISGTGLAEARCADN